MSRRHDPARGAAFDVLAGVRGQGAYANLLLAQVLREHDLSGRDAAFTTELVSGTLRLQGTYDAIIAAKRDGNTLLAQIKAVREMK